MRGEPAYESGTASVAGREPGRDGVNRTVTVQASWRWSTRPTQPSATTS